ncbi:MAG: hypothetical protein ABI553_10250 [Chloroflexota bacterium]
MTFKSIFPACYQGRWRHIHLEVYPDLEAATDEANKIATSQVALPKDACELVDATAGYESSVRTRARSRSSATTSSATTAASTSSGRSAPTWPAR